MMMMTITNPAGRVVTRVVLPKVAGIYNDKDGVTLLEVLLTPHFLSDHFSCSPFGMQEQRVLFLLFAADQHGLKLDDKGLAGDQASFPLLVDHPVCLRVRTWFGGCRVVTGPADRGQLPSL